jgi:hypothetical protein
MAGPTVQFNAQSGFCNQGGRMAIEKAAPAAVQEALIIDQLTGSMELLKASTLPLPACKDPGQVSDSVKYKGPKLPKMGG